MEPDLTKLQEPGAPPRALIADDHGDVVEALRLLLKAEGYHVEGVASPDALLQALARDPFDLVLVDLNYTRDTTSGQEGLELLTRIRKLDRDVPVVAMTAWGSIELAVDAMRTGVDDFIQKPWDNTRLLKNLSTQLQAGRARRVLQRMRAETGDGANRIRPTGPDANELAAAREIQRNLLPTRLPVPEGADVVAFWEPVGNVGGDFYDSACLDDRRTWLCIGDVAGKGVSAALLMANVQALVRSSAQANMDPAALCANVNQELCTRIAPGRFVSFFYCVYDACRRHLLYSTAGHNPPILVRRGGTTTRLNVGGAVLGIFPGGSYEQDDVRLDDGDRLVLFTDGITEVLNGDGVEFGEDRLLQLIADHRHLSAGRLQEVIVSAVRDFSGGTFDDDATLIVLAVR
jgi:sigma-B regulation protein RsbU (phosphoserine phosphatase)